MTPGVLGIIAACFAGFLLQGQAGSGLLVRFALWPPGSGFEPWQLLSHALLHGNWSHLLVNMFGLFMFGQDVERLWGTRRFLIFFAVCVATGALTHLAVMQISGELSYAIGASGGVFGVVLAFGLAFPKRDIMLVFPPIPMKAWVLVVLYAFFELYSGAFMRGTGVGHFAHLGGMIGGLILFLLWRARPASRRG